MGVGVCVDTDHTHRALLAEYPVLAGEGGLARTARAAIEDALFQRTYPLLIAHYGAVCAAADARADALVKALAARPPAFYGVSEKYWLLPQVGEEIEPEHTPPPYAAAVTAFARFSHAETPADKARAVGSSVSMHAYTRTYTHIHTERLASAVHCSSSPLTHAGVGWWVVETTREIVSCVAAFWNARGIDASVTSLEVSVHWRGASPFGPTCTLTTAADGGGVFVCSCVHVCVCVCVCVRVCALLGARTTCYRSCALSSCKASLRLLRHRRAYPR
jgi:hypothetical protein